MSRFWFHVLLKLELLPKSVCVCVLLSLLLVKIRVVGYCIHVIPCFSLTPIAID